MPPPLQSAYTHVSDERDTFQSRWSSVCARFFPTMEKKSSMSMCNAEQLQTQILQIKESRLSKSLFMNFMKSSLYAETRIGVVWRNVGAFEALLLWNLRKYGSTLMHRCDNNENIQFICSVISCPVSMSCWNILKCFCFVFISIPVCKSCIVKHFFYSNRCPTCSIIVHETQPLYNIRYGW